MEVCVVCGQRARQGKDRRSGFKCKSCVGKASKGYLRYLCGKADAHKELFNEHGFAQGQVVEWLRGDTVARGVVGKPSETDRPGWWPAGVLKLRVGPLLPPDAPAPSSPQASGEAGGGSLSFAGDGGDEIGVDDAYPVVDTQVNFVDGKRPGYRVCVSGSDGCLRQSVYVKGEARNWKEVTKLEYISEPPSLSFPELGITGKIWLPTGQTGWKSAAAIAWQLCQLAEASGIEHNLPKAPPQLAASRGM
ncbi:hypothetical protein DIPPA_14090 [Diplonema papillatum]|nr:hypothetical protein DIPPA_14090 [Diplonema papillatum]